MQSEDAVMTTRGRTAWITLNRPAELNTLNPAMLDAIEAGLGSAEDDPDIMSIVFIGSGPGFCAGADLKFLDNLPEYERLDAKAAFVERAGNLITRIAEFPKPVIAAINGIAVGGGMELLLAADLAVAAESARIGDAHANFAQVPGAGGAIRLPRKVGPSFAKYLFFTGDILPARDFLATGLLHAVVDDEGLEAAAQALADKIATKSPLMLRRIKQLADNGWDMPIDVGLKLENLMNGWHAHSHDCKEGIAAFIGKRAPAYRGD